MEAFIPSRLFSAESYDKGYVAIQEVFLLEVSVVSGRKFSRRNFLRASAGGLTAAGFVGHTTVLAPRSLRAAPGGRESPSDRIGLGIIGVGMQGSGLLKRALSLPGVECVGAAELYDGRARLAREIAGKGIFTTRDYRELLVRPGVDAVIVATPDHWHRKLVVDCCNAGKDVYCEKPMSHTAQEGLEMIAAEQKNKRIVQVGSQRRSSVVYEKAKEILDSGALGTITLVEATLGRNSPTGAWQYPVPPDASEETIDWQTWLGKAPPRPFDGARWARWRCWRDYGTGVAGDLFVHLITGIHYILGVDEPPLRAQSMGGLFRWKDGRDVPDTLSTLYEYSQFPVYVRVSLGSHSEEVTRFLGTGGTLEVNYQRVDFTPQDGKDHRPSYFSQSWPYPLRLAFSQKWHEENDPGPGTGKVTASTQRYVRPDNYNSVRDHLYNFFHSVRTRKESVQDATFGHHAALGCHMANYSYFNQTMATWDAQAKKMQSG